MKVLFVYSDPNCSCTRKCTFELSKGLSYYLNTSICLFNTLSEKHFLENDIIIFQRLGANGVLISQEERDNILNLISKYKDKSTTIYQIDDLLINNNDLVKSFIKAVDAVIVPNESYYKHIYELNNNIFYLRTFIDIESIEKITPTLNLPKNKLKLLWASTGQLGSEFMHELIPNIKDTLPYATIYCLGSRSSEFRKYSNTECFQILSFNKFIEYIKECDIVLNPIHINNEFERKNKDFINCKSEIKYLNAAINKKPIISSKSFSYEYAIKNGINGFLLDNDPQLWVDAIRQLLKDDLKKEMVQNAYKDVFENYNLKKRGEDLSKIIKDLINYKFYNESNYTLDVSQEYSNKIVGAFVGNQRTLKQEFISIKKNLCKIKLFIATYQRINTCKIYFRLLDDKENIVRESEIDCETLSDNDWMTIEFNPISNSENKTYTIELKTNGTFNNCITFYCFESKNLNFKNLEMFLNKKQVSIFSNACLKFQTICCEKNKYTKVLYVPKLFSTTGGAGRFINTISEKMSKYFTITNNIFDKGIDVALINAHGDFISKVIDLRYNNPNVAITHRLDGLLSREKISIGDLYLKNINEYTDHIIYQSQHCKDVFTPLLKDKNHSLIYNGSIFTPKEKLELRGDLKIAHLTSIGESWKNVDALYKFIEQVKNDPTIQFYIGGFYISYEELKQKNLLEKFNSIRFTDSKNEYFYNLNKEKFNKYPNVTYLGYMYSDEIMSLLSSVDYLFFPSIKDCCPNTVIESLCCDTPVAYHNSGGTPELVHNAGIDITQFNEDYSKLAEFMKRYKSLHKTYAKKQKEKFNIKGITQKYVEILNKTYNNKKKIKNNSDLNIGWIMCAGENAGSARIGGYNLHNTFKSLGIKTSILHANTKYSYDLDVPYEEIIPKLKDKNIVIFQKVCKEKAYNLAKYCKDNGIKTIFSVGDLVDSKLFEIADLVITSSPKYVEIIHKNYRVNSIYLEDGIEYFTNTPKKHKDNKDLTIGWFGNKDKFNDILKFKSILNPKDSLITFSNTSKANYEMGYPNNWDVKFLANKLMEDVDIVFIPINTLKEENLVKSANRLTLSHHLGIPTISTKIPSYFSVSVLNAESFLFADYNDLNTWKEHLEYLRDYKIRNKIALSTSRLLYDRYSPRVIAKEWVIALRNLL